MLLAPKTNRPTIQKSWAYDHPTTDVTRSAQSYSVHVETADGGAAVVNVIEPLAADVNVEPGVSETSFAPPDPSVIATSNPVEGATPMMTTLAEAEVGTNENAADVSAASGAVANRTIAGSVVS